jgi:hypothetical protein
MLTGERGRLEVEDDVRWTEKPQETGARARERGEDQQFFIQRGEISGSASINYGSHGNGQAGAGNMPWG